MPHQDSPLKRIHWHPFRNAGTETIPAFGVMRITGVENRNGVAVYTVDKPSTTFQRLYLINGPKQVAAEGYGSGTFDVTYALCSSSASPAYGESWGAKHSEWLLFQHRPGFFILGGYTGDGAAQRAMVRQLWTVDLDVPVEQRRASHARLKALHDADVLAHEAGVLLAVLDRLVGVPVGFRNRADQPLEGDHVRHDRPTKVRRHALEVASGV